MELGYKSWGFESPFGYKYYLSMGKISPSALKYVESLNLPDLKRACIMRGLEFEKVGDLSTLGLQSWFLKNFDLPVDHKLLEEYDIWAEDLLRSRNVDEALLNPYFRLSAVAERNENGDIVKRKRVRSMVPKVRKKKERTKEGLFTGTKKAYTYELAKQGLSKKEVLELVKKKYPEARDKSLGIWYNRAKKAMKNGNKGNKTP